MVFVVFFRLNWFGYFGLAGGKGWGSRAAKRLWTFPDRAALLFYAAAAVDYNRRRDHVQDERRNGEFKDRVEVRVGVILCVEMEYGVLVVLQGPNLVRPLSPGDAAAF